MEGNWHPDPTGRHELRYWDGSTWTAAVSDAGRQADDPPTWPAPPQPSGLGLRSGYLRYLRRGGGPWPVLDGAGDHVGQVARGSFSVTGRSAGLWDMADTLWLTVKQSIHGTQILAGDRQVGSIQWHGVGALSTVDITMHLMGRMRARMRARRGEFTDGSARVLDPGGGQLLALAIEHDAQTPVLTLRRLVGLPDEYEYLVQALVPALILELDSRADFDAVRDDPSSTIRGPGVWPD